MTRIEEMEHRIRRERRDMTFTAVLVIAMILLAVLVWARS
jgi:hypothetical protein